MIVVTRLMMVSGSWDRGSSRCSALSRCRSSRAVRMAPAATTAMSAGVRKVLLSIKVQPVIIRRRKVWIKVAGGIGLVIYGRHQGVVVG